ncbi:winged helix-turn-helix domain-containing protein [Shewanella eurypsychrophilus]|uniref:Winged helix-turn-helix domain-containing protein n=1 Tax=Shewanella eurypsychrophilus TaxID=2593656 RepID=A0ABX6VC22_9GAMM|nr:MULTISPECIES: winged helix-turn-helix domain-containing protein [Shewanella]QFU24691.1 CadC family transcriptional regulator [Shewanella sp. YLB-09]QPG59883.1 winged helix-turn-helix domain-containing protein [Shewanella eurypsychrophilus]
MLKVTPYLSLDAAANQLVDLKSDQIIKLTFSESAVLKRLLLSSDSVCSKDDLLEAGWPDRVVATTSLTQCISTLRKKLEPYREVQLKTLARRGYQLHVAKPSNITMLAVNDADSLRSAIIDVSLLVKISGIVFALLLMLTYWYFSDYHKFTQALSKLSADKTVELNITGIKGSTQLIYTDSAQHLHPSMWEKHLNSPDGIDAPFKSFNAFATTDGQNYSMAICPGAIGTACEGKGLINVTSIDSEPAGLDIHEFIKLSKRMEKRIRYNRIMLPPSVEGEDKLVEHNYHTDVYFPVKGELLIRADISMSLIYNSDDTGEFHFSTCITDQDCLTTPIKYLVRGPFKQYSETVDGIRIDTFQVKVQQKNLLKPDQLNDSAIPFYRELRKRDIQDKELYFYRVYQDDKTAVWIVPLFGSISSWFTYSTVDI